MSVVIDSLKKHNAWLQNEVEILSLTVDELAGRLRTALEEIKALRPPEVDKSPMQPAGDQPAEGEVAQTIN